MKFEKLHIFLGLLAIIVISLFFLGNKEGLTGLESIPSLQKAPGFNKSHEDYDVPPGFDPEGGTSSFTPEGGSSSSGPLGIPGSQIPSGQDDLYILKSEVVPPVCPKCPDGGSCPRQTPCPPCPACARCPEPAFDCRKVPNYSAVQGDQLPQPILNSFAQFGI